MWRLSGRIVVIPEVEVFVRITMGPPINGNGQNVAVSIKAMFTEQSIEDLPDFNFIVLKGEIKHALS